MIERALAVLYEASGPEPKAQTRGVALALYILRGHCPDEWLVEFWTEAGAAYTLGRSQTLHACYNGIERQMQLKRSAGHGTARQK